MNNASLTDLPDDVLVTIMGSLKPKYLGRLCLTCQQLNNLSQRRLSAQVYDHREKHRIMTRLCADSLKVSRLIHKLFDPNQIQYYKRRYLKKIVSASSPSTLQQLATTLETSDLDQMVVKLSNQTWFRLGRKYPGARRQDLLRLYDQAETYSVRKILIGKTLAELSTLASPDEI